jgi:hypothetical protein
MVFLRSPAPRFRVGDRARYAPVLQRHFPLGSFPHFVSAVKR